MQFDREKFKALVLYVLWRTGNHDGFGATKLNKVLWFSEARSFEALGKPISGETFVRDKFGPRARHVKAVCDELESEGLAERFTERVYDYEVTRYRAFQPPDTSQFTNEQLSLVDWWIRHVSEDHTASSISKLSHDYSWQIAGMGEELPLYAYLAARIRAPRTEEEHKWAQEEAKRLGLK